MSESSPSVQRQHRALPVPEGLDGVRADVALTRLLGVTRSTAADLLRDGDVSLDGETILKSHRVHTDAWLEVLLPAPPQPFSPSEEPVPGLEVLHADDDIVVVNKPAIVAAHPSSGWRGHTVLEGLRSMGHRISVHGRAEQQGIVHRLDVGTTGVMVVAKSERAYSSLKNAFRERRVEKRYHAVAQGHPDPSSGVIDAPIGHHPGGEWKFAVMRDGRPSITHYATIEAFPAATLLDIKLETGRTHQIRVHLSALKHPCVGDRTYGADPTLAERLGLTRQWLHAHQLAFEHPGSREWVEFTAPYPEDLAAAVEKLRV